jgi:RNA polymerase sigma-70 factor (ECF subfamily)
VARATRIVVTGGESVAKLIAAWGSGTFWDGIEVAPTVVNGIDAMTMRRDGELIGVVTVTGSAGRVDEVMWMVNPGKLSAV